MSEHTYRVNCYVHMGRIVAHYEFDVVACTPAQAEDEAFEILSTLPLTEPVTAHVIASILRLNADSRTLIPV